MFKTELMKKIRIICLEQDRQKLIEAVHELGLLDVRKSEISIQDDIVSGQINELSDYFIRTNGALKILDNKISRLKLEKGIGIEKINHIKLSRLFEEIKKEKALDKTYVLAERENFIEEDLQKLGDAHRIAKMFEGINISFGGFGSRVLAFTAFILDNKDKKEFETEIHKAGAGEYELIEKQLEKNRMLAFVAYKISAGAAIEKVLKKFSNEDIDIRHRYLSGTPEDIQKFVDEKKEGYAIEMEAINKEFAALAKTKYARLRSLNEMVHIEMQRAAMGANFKKTQKTTLVEGWTPAKTFKKFKTALGKALKNRVVVEETETKEIAPTLLNRPGILKSFDYLMEFFSLPRSDEIDPTWVFIFSFLVFYGLMVSDVGYGLLSLGLAYLITKKTNPEGLLYNVSKIWEISAFSAILFGFLSNQYFGFNLNHYFINYQAFDWIKSIPMILLATVFFGIAQIIIGLAFSFVNNYNKGHRLLAISKITSIIAIVAGVITVAGFLFHVFSGTVSLAAVVIAIPAFAITFALSGIEAAETINLITHPLSYARIFGFGLASIIIAMLIDQAFTPTLSHGIPVFIVFLALFIILHFLNMIMGIFEGIIQGVRLNYVEFFSKFYIGGGMKFKPFSFKRNYTRE
ncbi:MAG: hypothetical protein M1331_01930 [Candidatus Marsarchaeota archaeon]|nr:hypothetical protein [Candidatus Marsarchaeota archaeon]